VTPGASESLVRQLLAHEERVRDSGQLALTLGLLTAVVALITAVGQVERGANRIYGVERDRPSLQKYLRALVLLVVAGLPALVSFLLLMAGGAIGASMQRWYHWDTAAVTAWNVARWPVSLGLIVVAVSLLFRYAPRRQQPGLSWLLVGAGVATALWWLVSLLLAAYVSESNDFGVTYGPLTGVMALLLWANLTGIALFVASPSPPSWKPHGSGSPGRPWSTRTSRWRSGARPRLPAALDGGPGRRPRFVGRWLRRRPGQPRRLRGPTR
jgi:YihY family inner membrane protein